MPQAANCSFCCSTVYSSMTRLYPGNRRFFLFTACAHAARAVTFCCSTKSNQKGNQGRTGTTHFAQVPVPPWNPHHNTTFSAVAGSDHLSPPCGRPAPRRGARVGFVKTMRIFLCASLSRLVPPFGGMPNAVRQRGLSSHHRNFCGGEYESPCHFVTSPFRQGGQGRTGNPVCSL